MTAVFVLALFFIVYGLLCVIFAFKEPPDFISSAFKIPSVMVFLPNRLVVPVWALGGGALFLRGRGDHDLPRDGRLVICGW